MAEHNQRKAAAAAGGVAGGRGGNIRGNCGDDDSDSDVDDENEGGKSIVAEYIKRQLQIIQTYARMNPGKPWPHNQLFDQPMSPWLPPPDFRMLPLEAVPDKCYYPTIFFFLPWYWAREQCGDAPMCPACGGSKRLVSKGYVQKRMLTHSLESTWCVTKRFTCSGCASCKDGSSSATWSGWDVEIRKNLPSGIQSMFPYHLEHRALVHVDLVSELATLVLDQTSVSACTRLYKERARSVFYGREAAWKQMLCAAMGVQPPQPPFDAQEAPALKDFGDFTDTNGYNGWDPDYGFWNRMLKAELERNKDLWTRSMQLVGGSIFKGDHSRKTAKLIRLKGVSIFKAVYTLMNEFNEIVGIWFTMGETQVCDLRCIICLTWNDSKFLFVFIADARRESCEERDFILGGYITVTVVMQYAQLPFAQLDSSCITG